MYRFVRCRACGLVYLLHPPSDGELAQAYADYLPHRGAAAWGRWAWAVGAAQRRTDRARLSAVRRTLPRGAVRGTVLDVGCGRPTFLAAVKRAWPTVRAVGTDWSSAGWRSDPSATWRDLELSEGLLPSAGLLGSCDVMTLWHVLEHLRDPVGALRSLRAYARPEGRVIIEVPNLASLSARLQGEHWGGYHTPRHMSAFTPETLTHVLSLAGWRNIRIRRYGTMDPYVLWWLGREDARGWPSDSLESRFLPFLAGKCGALPVTLLQRVIPLGIMTATATA